MRSVYLMKTNNDDLYKVGIAYNVHKRLSGLQTSNGNKVFIITYVRTGDALGLEKEVHSMLATHRQTGGREWFKLTPEEALKVCMYLHQKAEPFYNENEIKQMIDQYSDAHNNLVSVRKELEKVTDKMGSDIQKSIARLNKYKPLPKPVKREVIIKLKQEKKTDTKIYEQAVVCVTEAGKASTSLLQRRLRIGYGRAARLMEQMEEQGIISPLDGIKARVVYSRYSAEKAQQLIQA